jgi:signal transduction histidine kinase
MGFGDRLVANLVALEHFLAGLRTATRRDQMLTLILRHVSALIPFPVAGLYLPEGEALDFTLRTCLPADKNGYLNQLVEEAIESGGFGWALKHVRPACFKCADGRQALVLAPLRTRQELLGVFAAVPASASIFGWSGNSLMLATHLACAAEAMLREELTIELQRQNRMLDSLVEERTEQLEFMLQERQRFMGIAAHDLRNLLAAISGYTEIALLHPDALGRQKTIEKISRSCQTMKVVIEDFLALNILQRSKDGAAGLFDLRSVINQVKEQAEFAAKAKGISVTEHLPPGPLLALGNAAHTHQILGNYVSNALKYSPPHSRTRILASARDRCWRIEVQDQGPGIPSAERDRLFVEFARISNRPTGGETSTRLGLSIVKALADAQGGKVGAEFPPSGGSIFWLELPSGAQDQAKA